MSLLQWIFGDEEVRATNLTWSYVFGKDHDDSNLSQSVAGEASTMLRHPAVWRCISLISGSIAKLPLNVYEKKDDDSVRIRSKSPANHILRYTPNEESNAYDFRRAQYSTALQWGNDYSWIERDMFGTPKAMWHLSSTATYPVREYTSSGKKLFYMTVDDEGQEHKLLAEDVFHLRGLGSDGLMGLPFNEFAAESIGVGLSQQRYTRLYFDNGGNTPTMLIVPANLKQPAIDELQEKWQELHGGINNAHKTGVLRGDVQVKEFQSIKGREAQLVEGRQFENVQVANWFGVPPHKVGAPISASYNSLEQENQAFLNESLDPWLVAYEQEASRKLVGEDWWKSGTRYAKFDRTIFLQADLKTRADWYVKGIQNGYFSRNDVRKFEDLPGIGKQGDQYHVSVQVQEENGKDDEEDNKTDNENQNKNEEDNEDED